ncbi:MAG: ABC transporter substrate-binding protein [Alphaproteobacteria bacterium]|nr:ABC transporter substrate-binding protein [Alphaproteobacteria bacterium]
MIDASRRRASERNGMRHLIFSLLLMALVAVATSALASENEGQCNTIVASGPPEYAPLSFLSDGQIIGVGPDISRMVGDRLGIGVQVRNAGSWRRAVRLHEVGEIELLVALYRTETRERDMVFSGPYWREDTVLIMHKDRPFEYDRWSDLISLKGGTIGGDSRGEAFDRFLKQKLDVIATPLQANLVAMLRAGRVDYLVIGRNSMFSEDFEAEDSDLITHPKAVDSHEVYMSFSRKSPCSVHAEAFSTELQRLFRDGSVERLYKKWHGNQ